MNCSNRWPIYGLLLALNLLEECFSQKSGITSNPDGSGSINFGPPDLSSEESESLHMPKQLQCDACKIIAYLLAQAFEKAERKLAKNQKNLPESEIIDTAERVCFSKFEQLPIIPNLYDTIELDIVKVRTRKHSNLTPMSYSGITIMKAEERYGITEIRGQKRLKGPGLDTENEPGVTQSGGKWPVRLHQMCEDYIGEVGEDIIYEVYAKTVRHNKFYLFEKFLCQETGKGLAHCSKDSHKLEL